MVYIVAYKRTPFGAFNGALSTVPATELAAFLIKSIQSSKGHLPDQLILGHALPAGCGQAPCTSVLRSAGLSTTIPSFTVNKVCASGMRAIMCAADAIRLGQANLILAGGMENMSSVPHYIQHSRKGIKFGGGKLVDGIEMDGLMDAIHQQSMGECGEKLAEDFKLSRERQDEWAKRSFSKAMECKALLSEEIISLNGLDCDEQLSKFNPEKMTALKPAFKQPNGTITAANSSPISDGAAMLMIASEEAVSSMDQSPIAKIIAYADAAVADPRDFPLAMVPAVREALQKAQLSISDIDLFEFNEAFSGVPEAVCRELNIQNMNDKVNVKGGAVAIGHPLGASGARVTGTLALSLHQFNASYGVAAVCNGGGGASAIVLQRLE